jgi:thiol-disulfide isomerase/thioredoxin
MTGVWILLAAVALALAFGGYRKLTDGKARVVRAGSAPQLSASRLGEKLGTEATFVQFSSSVCAPCRATHRVLADLTAGDPTLTHVDIDAETRLDLAEEFGITRTPTVLLLDAGGVVRGRIVGATRRADVLAALKQVAAGHAAA